MKLLVSVVLLVLEAGTGSSATAGKTSDISRLGTLNEKTMRLFEHGESEAALPVAAEIVSILEKSAERIRAPLLSRIQMLRFSTIRAVTTCTRRLFTFGHWKKMTRQRGITLSGRPLRQSLFVLYANTGVYAKAESILRREPEVASEPLASGQSETLLATTQRGAAWRKARFLLALGWLKDVQGEKDVALAQATNALEISKQISAPTQHRGCPQPFCNCSLQSRRL